VFHQAIDFCVDVGIPLIQVAGYYAYYEAWDAGQRQRYVECLAEAAGYAACAGVMLGIENVDGTDVTSITKAVEICDEVGSTWLQLYPDIGNLAEQQLDTAAELAAGAGRMLALHVKDVLPGVPRRVPMGGGIADFRGAFAELARQQWSGRLMIEMWGDDAHDSADKARDAKRLIEDLLCQAGIAASSPGLVHAACGANTA